MGLFDWLKKKNDDEIQNDAVVEKEEVTAEEGAVEDTEATVEEDTVAQAEAEAVSQEPTIEESTVEEPSIEEIALEEIAVEEPTIEETTTETTVEEAITEEATVEEPITEVATEEITENAETEIAEDSDSANSEEIAEEVAEEVIEEVIEEVKDEVKEEKPKGFFAKIKQGLSKTRNNIMSGIENVLKSFTSIDEEFYEELEEALIMADLGVETSVAIIDKVRECVKKEKIHDVEEVREVIVRVITEMLEEGSEELNLPKPSVILVIGVNGVGKTTTIGKLTNNYKAQGKSVLLAAADTFRAAAIDQLEVWGERNGVDVIKHQEGSDPAAVVFDAVQAAKSRNTDILICDTAGRLHNKKNLMEELRKIAKIINREYEQAHVEVFLVLDATTGQNALQQAKLFNEVADISGIVLTKLDGTAKGGIVIAIKNELNIPVRFIGVGEGINDLQEFNATDFSKALFAND